MFDPELPECFKLKVPPEVYGDTTSEPQNSPDPTSQSNNMQSEMVSQPNTETSTPMQGKVIEVNADPGYSSDPSMMPPAMRSDFVPQAPFPGPAQQFANAYAPYYPAQQQISSLAYPQQIPITVNGKNSPEKSFFDKSFEVLLDYQRNKIYLLRQREGNRVKPSIVNVNGAQNSVILDENKYLNNVERTKIADGTITVGSKVIRADEKFLTVGFTGEDGAKTEGELTLDQISDNKYLSKILSSAGLNLDRSYLKYIIMWLTSQYYSAETVKEPVDGVGEDGRPLYHNEHTIRENAADGIDVIKAVKAYMDDNNGMQKMFYLALGCMARMALFLSANKLYFRTVVALCADNMAGVIGNLSAIYGLDRTGIRVLSNFKPDVLKSSVNDILVFYQSDESDHILKTRIHNLINTVELNGRIADEAQVNNLPIFVFEDLSLVNKYDMSKYCRIRCIALENYDLSGILYWFQRKMMDDPEFVSYLLASINKFGEEIAKESIGSTETELFAIER